jgi:polysaccharide export outer membrane protein
MQDRNLKQKDTVVYVTPTEIPYIIHVKDVLNIKIVNINDDNPDIIPSVQSTNANIMNLYYTGYPVNDSGYVDIPQIGLVKVEGLTIYECINKIKEAVKLQLPYATVMVKPIFKISVLGEVKMPGVQYISNGQLTIFEAIGYAGDLTDYGNRKKVKLVRTIGNDKKVFYINLIDPNIMKTDFFYIQPNDVIYVEPFKVKYWRLNSSNIPLIFSTITLGIVILNTINK